MSMYHITRMRDGTFWCEGRVQDGTERWSDPTEREAIQSMIRFARVMNGSYITQADITFANQEPDPPRIVSEADYRLLADLKAGKLVALPHDDLRLRYRITDEECEMVQSIREGKIELID